MCGKFTKALGPLGVNVAEMTGDMQLTRKDMETTNVIVTVPEKWDVLTRNNSGGGGASDETLMRQVELLIIDEVHDTARLLLVYC